MILGESVAEAAVQAMKNGEAVQDIDISELQETP